MHPILLDLGFVKIYSYGLMMAIAFAVGIYLFFREGTRLHLPDKFLNDIVFYIIISSLIGGRLLYICMNIAYYIAHPLLIFKIWEGGMVYYGGFFLAVTVVYIYLKNNRVISFLRFGDLVAPILVLGHGIGRIGCFLAGCCYGTYTSCSLGVEFFNVSSLAPVGIKLHPAQLYEACGDFIIFLVLWCIRKKAKFKGQILALYLILYSIFRFFIEFLRGDERGIFFMLTLTQALSLVLLIIGSIIFYVGIRNRNHNYRTQG